MTTELEHEIDGAMVDFFQRFSREFIQQGIATYLFAKEVARPHGVNEDSKPNYERMAKYAADKAAEVTPFLLEQLDIPAQVCEEDE